MERTLRARSPLIGLLVLVPTVLLVTGFYLLWSRSGYSDDRPTVSNTASMLIDGLELSGDWEPMTVVYEVDGTVIRLEYINESLWRKEVIESATNPDVVGIVSLFDGTAYTEYDPQLMDPDGRATILREDITDGVVVPERWLWPGLARDLVARRFTVESTAQPHQIVLTQTGTVSCPPTPPALGDEEPPRLPSHLEVCYSNDTYQETERYILRTDIAPPLPVMMTIAGEGEVTIRAEVRSVDLSEPDIDVTLRGRPEATPTT